MLNGSICFVILWFNCHDWSKRNFKWTNQWWRAFASNSELCEWVIFGFEIVHSNGLKMELFALDFASLIFLAPNLTRFSSHSLEIFWFEWLHIKAAAIAATSLNRNFLSGSNRIRTNVTLEPIQRKLQPISKYCSPSRNRRSMAISFLEIVNFVYLHFEFITTMFQSQNIDLLPLFAYAQCWRFRSTIHLNNESSMNILTDGWFPATKSKSRKPCTRPLKVDVNFCIYNKRQAKRDRERKRFRAYALKYRSIYYFTFECDCVCVYKFLSNNASYIIYLL